MLTSTFLSDQGSLLLATAHQQNGPSVGILPMPNDSITTYLEHGVVLQPKGDNFWISTCQFILTNVVGNQRLHGNIFYHFIDTVRPSYPIGQKLGLLKASKEAVENLVVRLPRSILLSKITKTSGIEQCPAMVKEHSKLLTASFRDSPMGICAPVIMMVFFKFSIIKDKALEVQAIVSVPCRIMKASYWSQTSSILLSIMLSLSMLMLVESMRSFNSKQRQEIGQPAIEGGVIMKLSFPLKQVQSSSQKY